MKPIIFELVVKYYKNIYYKITMIRIWKKLFIALFFISGLVLWFILLPKYSFENKFSVKLAKDNKDRRFLIKTEGCQIPLYDPFDITVRHLYKSTGNLSCPEPLHLLSFNRTHLTLNLKIAKNQFGIVKCYYRAIRRKDDGQSDNKYEFTESKELKNIIKVTDEFLQVECKNSSNSIVYTELLPFIQIKPEIEAKSQSNFQKWMGKTKNEIKERMSVTLIGIDSVSRLNMLRHMPKTYNFLVNHMNAIDLQGFIKLADNTLVNVVPLLAGMFLDECWNETMSKQPFDYLNLVWKEFGLKGYRTLYAEDDPQVSAFNFLKGGFSKQPTDYYMRPFTLAVDKSNVRTVNEHCYNHRPESEVTLQWITDFLITFKQKPTFAFLFNTRLTHYHLNHVSYAEEIYYKFLQRYVHHDLNRNSVLIVFSDHGLRFGPIRDTYVGKIEERMPFVFLVFPPWFRTKYPNLWRNLKTNQHRLTTFFDLYETLKQILHFTGEEMKTSVNNRGINLFSEIPSERTCENAAILPHWCTCHEKKIIALDDARVKTAARVVIHEINKKLATEIEKCSILCLDRIVDARANVLNDKILKFRDSKNDVIDRTVVYGKRLARVWEYLLTISVKPSSALFEATVKYFEENGNFVLSGDISRINAYGNSSHCVESSKLKKFCYCV